MIFDSTISLGTVLATLLILAGLLTSYTRLVRGQTRIEERVNLMWRWFEGKIDRMNGDPPAS